MKATDRGAIPDSAAKRVRFVDLIDSDTSRVQFHPEIKPENISLMINYAGEEIGSLHPLFRMQEPCRPD